MNERDNENATLSYRQEHAEHDIKNLKQVVYGTPETKGLASRVDVTETRLQIFWWVLAVIGSAAVAVLIQTLMRVLER